MNTDLDIKQRRYLEKIDESAKSLLRLINDILDVSKIEAGKLLIENTNFNLFKLVDSVINLIEYKAVDKNIELVVSYDKNMGHDFFGDSLRLGQILSNLLGNAVKFTEEGEVGLYVKRKNENRYRFEVMDTGIGLTSDEQLNLFKTFSQADSSTTRKYGGTGLGLTISKQLIELMGGIISVESTPNIGSKFIFEIDLIENKGINEINLFSNKYVLIVDDCSSWHDILGDILISFGIKVEHAFSGQEAIDKVKDCTILYDLILMDWNMPILNGVETTQAINNYCDEFPENNCCHPIPPSVIMVSSFRHESIVMSAKQVGIDIFLQKPVNPSLLYEVLSGVFSPNTGSHYASAKDTGTLLLDMSSLKGRNILLAEDNDINQEIILGLLETSGIQIDIANNGKEAIDIYSNNPRKYDLILMDIQMPVMDGYEATKILRSMDKNIPIIALTANAMREDVKKTKSIGMNEHLNKPIDVDSLYKTLLQYMSKNNATHKNKNNSTNDKSFLPGLKNIDVDIGLKNLAGNKKLYLKILTSFYHNNVGLDISSLNDDDLYRLIHTLKGLTASIGAIALFEITKRLHDTKDRSYISILKIELDAVIEELKGIIITDDIEKSNKLAITQPDLDELIFKLYTVLQTRTPKKCELVIIEINKYSLEDKWHELFSEVKHMVSNYNFTEAIALMDKSRGE